MILHYCNVTQQIYFLWNGWLRLKNLFKVFWKYLYTYFIVLLLILTPNFTISRLNRIGRQLQPVELAAGELAVNWQTTSAWSILHSLTGGFYTYVESFATAKPSSKELELENGQVSAKGQVVQISTYNTRRLCHVVSHLIWPGNNSTILRRVNWSNDWIPRTDFVVRSNVQFLVSIIF